MQMRSEEWLDKIIGWLIVAFVGKATEFVSFGLAEFGLLVAAARRAKSGKGIGAALVLSMFLVAGAAAVAIPGLVGNMMPDSDEQALEREIFFLEQDLESANHLQEQTAAKLAQERSRSAELEAENQELRDQLWEERLKNQPYSRLHGPPSGEPSRLDAGYTGWVPADPGPTRLSPADSSDGENSRLSSDE